MTLADVPAGASVFVDANPFVYAFAPEPALGPPCFALLERIARSEVDGYTSSLVLCDVAHRLMTLEACAAFGWPHAGIAHRLKRHPAEIKKLHRFRQALDQIAESGVRVLPIDPQDVMLAGDLCIQHGLLSGDGLVAAVMQRHGIALLASNDADFDGIAGILRYAPA